MMGQDPQKFPVCRLLGSCKEYCLRVSKNADIEDTERPLAEDESIKFMATLCLVGLSSSSLRLQQTGTFN